MTADDIENAVGTRCRRARSPIYGAVVVLVSLLWLLASCGCMSTAGNEEQTDLGPEGERWSEASFAQKPGFHRGAMEVDDRQRDFAVYLPESGSESDSTLLFVLHGGGGDIDRIRNLGFEQQADVDGGVVVYPEAFGGRWADGRGVTDADVDGVDDVEFVLALLDALEANLEIDASSVVATGPSNGGMMSFRIGCEAGDRFTGIAPVIAAMPKALKDDCRPTDSLQVLGIQGTEDPLIDIDGGAVVHDNFERLGAGGDVESATSTMEWWAEALNCESEPEIDDLEPVDDEDSTRVRRTRFTGCGSEDGLRYFVVDGMGHTWPPRDGVLRGISGPSSPQLDATELIWQWRD